MKRPTLASVSRCTTQLAAFFLVATSVASGGECVDSNRENQLIGHMVVTATAERTLLGHVVVTATREPALLGHMLVAATRLAPADVAVADLGHMTVTAARGATLARNDEPPVKAAAL
jgi:hypothetical protein